MRRPSYPTSNAAMGQKRHRPFGGLATGAGSPRCVVPQRWACPLLFPHYPSSSARYLLQLIAQAIDVLAESFKRLDSAF